MARSKENYKTSKSDFIRYLYNEGKRKGTDKHPNFYSEIIRFVNSTEGQETFKKFQQIEPSKLGISVSPVKNIQDILKRAFQ